MDAHNGRSDVWKHDRVVKVSDLSPDGNNAAWVRTPLFPLLIFYLILILFSNYDVFTAVTASAYRMQTIRVCLDSVQALTPTCSPMVSFPRLYPRNEPSNPHEHCGFAGHGCCSVFR